MPRPLLAGLFVLAVAGLSTACMPRDDAAIPAEKASSIVLQPGDLPGEFTLFAEGPISGADVAPGPREDPSRFDRQGGWKARFRSPQTEGPLVVESRVDVFESSEGAERDFEAYEAELATILEELPAAERLDDPDLGDEALAMTNLQEAFEDVRFFNVIWRERNVTASIIVQGFDGNVSNDDAVALARKQQRRMEAAAD